MPDLTYAIGDIHGRSDLLLLLLEAIERDAQGRSRHLVFLGDYVDRGPASAGVVSTLRRLQEEGPDSITCLMGNHEAMLLDALTDPAAESLWLMNGGSRTLAAFEARGAQELPADVLAWLAALPIRSEDDRRHYVHAGFRPGRTIAQQLPDDFLWIREPFLSAEFDFGKHVVHGHTALMGGRPDARTHRTNLDTAAAYGGPLTAGRFGPEDARASGFLQVVEGGRLIVRNSAGA
jgi:serine/threonine protein phosphatase 1